MKEPIFSGLSLDARDLSDARAKNTAYVERRSAFRESFKKLKDLPARNQVKALRKFIFEDNKIDDFLASELMQVFTAFRECRSFPDMLKMALLSSNDEFTKSTIVRESCVVAYNHARQYSRALEEGEALLAVAPSEMGRGEIYGAFGKAWLKKHELAVNYSRLCHDPGMSEEVFQAARAEYVENFPGDKKCLKVVENAQYALEQSRDNYEAGFLASFEYYPGINTVYRMLELGDYDGSRNMARMVYLSCLRDGARESMDSRCAATLVEAACAMGGTLQEVLSAVTQFIKTDPEAWHVESLCNALTSMRETARRYTSEDYLFSVAAEAVEKGVPVYANKPASLSEAFEQSVGCPMSRSLLSSSFNYRGITSNFAGANFIPGNLQFGGQLPDHCVTRSDIREFSEMLDTPLATLVGAEVAREYPPTLREIYSVEHFLKISDIVIRQAFGTDQDNLEFMQSPGHHAYDERIRALLSLSGAEGKAAGDSRTNISVIFGLGLGDCRHHAQVKQLLFDVWQKSHMNNCLRSAYEALKESDIETYYHSIEEFHDIERVELRTLDVTVKAAVEMKEKYYPVCNEAGIPVAREDGALSVLEDHTLNIILKRGPDGRVKSLRFSDSFYQNQYSWRKMDIPLQGILFDNDGRMIISASTLKTVDLSSGRIFDQPIYLKPTSYAGKRDAMPQDEIGRMLFLGMPMGNNFDLVTTLSISRQQKMQAIDHVRQWHGAAQDQKDAALKNKKPRP